MRIEIGIDVKTGIWIGRRRGIGIRPPGQVFKGPQ